jgi:hypothetical protein
MEVAAVTKSQMLQEAAAGAARMLERRPQAKTLNVYVGGKLYVFKPRAGGALELVMCQEMSEGGGREFPSWDAGR